MKNSRVVIAICICVIFICSGCEKKIEKQAAGENGSVTMSAVLTEDYCKQNKKRHYDW